MSQATTTSHRQSSGNQGPQDRGQDRPAKKGDDRFEEGPVARSIEEATAQVPSDVYLWTAGGIAAASLTLMLCGRKHGSLFLGQWVAPVLISGLYNKIVKTQGHDRRS